MKLSSVVLLSVNLVAASQVAANAADTASFLQDALSPSSQASAKGAAPQRASRPSHAKKHNTRAYVAMTPAMDGVKIRPFVPGRYLPSESELQAKKDAEREAAQQATFSYPGLDNSGVLSGKVSSNNDIASYLPQAAAYAMSKPTNQAYFHKVTQAVKQAAKKYSAAQTRSVPGMNPVMPGQVAHFHGAPGAVSGFPEPQQIQASMPMRIPQPSMYRNSMPVQVPQAPQHVAAPTPVVPLPELSKWDSAQLDKLVETNMPENVYQGFNGDMRAGQGNPGLAGTGPSPFPLSSVPMNHGRGISPVGQQARFGSWHGGHSNLPQGSFHSYVPVHMAGPMSVKINHFGRTHKTGHQAISLHSGRTHSHHHEQHHAAQAHPKAEKPKAQPFIATYPMYRRYNSM